ncbi:MAG: hypothetical protein JRJ68_01125 [Deltaproteobacteria bacterium]|nr:hypothetical protein [Deltaproteobacteria bacterium]
MISTAKRLPGLIIIFVIFTLLSGCDNLSEFFQNLSTSQQSSEESESTSPSYEKTLLMDILEDQRALVEEMQYASNNGERNSIKESYEKFLRLDQNYQDEFQKHEGALAAKDGWEISKMHQQIIRSLPTFSSLMQ